MTRRTRYRLGALVPFTNTNLEPDLALLAPLSVSIHVARMGGYDAEQIPDADQMAGMGAADIDEPLRLLIGARPDAVLYGCTSATLTHGPDFDRALAEKIEAAHGAITVTAAGALVHGLNRLGVSRVGFASPYVGQINDLAIDFLARSGFRTVARADIGRVLDNDGQGALTPGEVLDLAVRADAPDVQAIVLSCTDMRSVEAVNRIEAATGKPVVCSNQAMMRQVADLLQIDGMRPCGRLLAA